MLNPPDRTRMALLQKRDEWPRIYSLCCTPLQKLIESKTLHCRPPVRDNSRLPARMPGQGTQQVCALARNMFFTFTSLTAAECCLGQLSENRSVTASERCISMTSAVPLGLPGQQPVVDRSLLVPVRRATTDGIRQSAQRLGHHFRQQSARFCCGSIGNLFRFQREAFGHPSLFHHTPLCRTGSSEKPDS